MKKIALVNSVVLNGGDAGIVYGTCDAISEIFPGAQIEVFAHKADAAAKYYHDLNLEPMPFDTWPRSRVARALLRRTYRLRNSLRMRTYGEREFLRKLKTCDAIVYCGGAYLNDSYDMKLLLGIMEATLDTGVPHMAYAHSIGPIRRPQTETAVRRLLNRFEIVTARDEASFTLLQNLGVRSERIALLADAALAMRSQRGDTLTEPDRTALRSIESFKRSHGSPLVVVSVRSWKFPGHQRAEMLTGKLHEQLVSLTGEILATTDWSVCFLSTCQGRREYGYDDSAVAQRVVADLGVDQRRVMVSTHAFAPRAYPYLIGTCADLVISMRMHLTIFSLLGGVPFLAIAYEKKSVELCSRLGIQEFCHPAESLDAHAALTCALRLYEHRSAVAEQLSQRREDLVELSKRNATLFAERCVKLRASGAE